MKFTIWSIFSFFTLSFAFDVAQYTSSQLLTVTGTATGHSFQFPISNAGDINKDGRDDIIIGGYGQEDGGSLESAYLIYGQSSFSHVNLDFEKFTVTPATPTPAGISITGTGKWDGFGTFVSGAGDIDGDGNDDFMISAYRRTAHQGRVYVIYGKSGLQNMDVLATPLDPRTTGFTITGNVNDNYLGFSISRAGKINGDDLDDIIVGIHGKNKKAGAAVVIYGESSATRSNINVNGSFATIYPETAGFSMLGKEEGDLFGYSVSNAGDVNGNKRADIIVGAPGNATRKGAVYVIYGRESRVNIDLSLETLDPATTGFVVKGSAEGDFFGVSVGAAGDFNGDGIDDIIIGSNSTEETKGAVYIIYGSKTPVNIDLLTDPLKAASTGFVIKGGNVGDQFGFSVKSVGDLNGDGFSDVMIGAPGQGDSSKGAVYVVYGRKSESLSDVIDLSVSPLDLATTGFMFSRDVEDGKFGYSIASGEFNKDGKTELFVGTMTKSDASPQVGYVIGLSEMCSDNCNECSLPTTCETCQMNYGLEESTLQCRQCNPIGEYYESNKCRACMSHCNKCTDGTSCDECSNTPGNTYGYQNATCILCPDVGKFLSGGNCDDCIENCNKCSDKTSCNECLSEYGYQNSTCIECPQPGKFKDGLECKDCLENCDECSDDKTCKSCFDGYGRWNSSTECINCTLQSKFLDGGECFDCIENCDECSDNRTCASCSDGHGRWNSSTECIKCPDQGKFLDNGECFDCIENCDECNDNKTCNKCLTDYGKLDGKCVICPAKTFLLNGVCEHCIDHCEECLDRGSCDVCSDEYGLLDKVCVKCPTKTYLSKNGKCEACIPDCEVCSGSTSCDKCLKGYGLLNSRCVKCPIGMFLSSDGKCAACGSNCDVCSDNLTCKACSSGYGIVDFTCVQCPQEGMYLSEGNCLACSEGCSQCQDSSVCQVCADYYMLTEWNTCVEKKEESGNVASSSTFEGASLIGAAISSGSSLPFNFGLTSKMVRNVKYLNITVSNELRQSFVSWTATSSFLKAPKSWGSESDSGSGLRMLQEVFGRYGMEPAFLINYWKTLVLTFVGMFLYGVFKVIEVCFTKENSRHRQIVRSVHIAASNFALTQFYSNLDDVVLYLAIDVRSSKLDASFGRASFIIGIILLAVGIIALSIHILLLRKYQGLKKKQAEFETFKSKSQNVDLIFKDFKDIGFKTQSFLLVILIRCIVASLIYALLFEYPFLQIFMLLVINLGMIVFLLVVRPFKDFFDTCGQFFSEFILLLVNTCMFILCIFDQAESKPMEAIEKLSRCVIVLNVILLVGCAVFLTISVLRLLYRAYKIYQDKRQTKSTSLVLSSLTKKLDALKLTQNMEKKTNNFEQSSESRNDLQNAADISDSNIALNLHESFQAKINTKFFPTDQEQMVEHNSVLYENQAEEDILNTTYGNLDLSGYFAERDMKLKYGAGGKPRKMKRFGEEIIEKKPENQEEKLSISLNHDEAADIDPNENKIEKDIIPLQDFGATFKKKKKSKAPKADSAVPKNNEATAHELTGSEVERDLQIKDDDQINPPKKFEEEVEKKNGEKNLSNSGIFNHDEAADINPDENHTENNLIPLQDFGATFKKKKKVQKPENLQENRLDSGTQNPNEGVHVEPSHCFAESNLVSKNEYQRKSPEIKNFERKLDEIAVKEESLPTSVDLNDEEDPNVQPGEVKSSKKQTVSLQDSESTFKEKGNIPKVEDVKVEHMREEVGSDLS